LSSPPTPQLVGLIPGPIAFEDVAVDFSLEEWVLLNPDQKALHKQIMEEMNGIVDSLGKAPSLMGISISKCSIILNHHSHLGSARQGLC
uniref:KRAB domain-containing protein n=1 Tax=Anolis carolinensis TaxID=28377 RepID=A0A803SWQ6_ANOCA